MRIQPNVDYLTLCLLTRLNAPCRHPSNLLLDRMSGKILHIDFGDCFEVAMTRDKFPEKIPFRLTRMLINAMEVTGIEGTYRSTCESVMRVLRNRHPFSKARQ